MTLRLAVATEDFGQPLRQAIAQAAKNKVQGLRLNARREIRPEEFSDTALRQLKHYVEEHQLKVAGLMYSSRHVIYDQQHLDQRLDGIRSAMTQAQKLGTSEVLVRVGRIPDPDSAASAVHRDAPTDNDVNSLRNPFSFAPTTSTSSEASDAQKFQLLCDIVNDLAEYGSRFGAVLQLQLSTFEPKRIQQLFSRLNAGAVGIAFDPAACVMTGSFPVQTFRDTYRQIGYIRLRDAQKDVDGGGIEVPFGDGIVDWTELLPTIVEADLKKWVCVERTGGDQRADDVREAIHRIAQLLPIPG
ncbi:MAG: sugar phosphate isomerase/epimerase [Planctomycetota bacterium]|nr:sugar phosphate isomerase/epimerase [Planctomycetota bacterium]